jgi:hypothetical protein
MPKVRRHNVPPALFQQFLDRVQSRALPASQLELLAQWLDTEPDVPEGQWYKRFSGMTVCGEGKLIKTLLLPGQAPKGRRLP